MALDAMKFLQAYIKEMIKVGGENLPKTISSTLGAKLGKLYKSKGISDIVNGLNECYRVLQGKPKITKINDREYEIDVTFRKKFCPVGGSYNPNLAELMQNSICIPYTVGLLNILDPQFKYRADLHECILKSKKNSCRYTLYLEEKDKEN